MKQARLPDCLHAGEEAVKNQDVTLGEIFEMTRLAGLNTNSRVHSVAPNGA